MYFKDLDFKEIIPFLKQYGDSENPFLARGYSKASRRPSIDFSLWLYYRILKNDIESIEKWIWEIVKYNPGIGTTRENFEKIWKSKVREIVTSSAYDYLANMTVQAKAELKTLLLLYAIAGSVGNGCLSSNFSLLMARALLPYNFSITNERKQRIHYKKYTNQCEDYMDIPKVEFDLKRIKKLRSDSLIQEFQTKLSKVQLTQRICFFPDSIFIYRDYFVFGNFNFRDDTPFRVGLLTYVNDLEFVVSKMTKDKIRELLAKTKEPSIKKSAKKKILTNAILKYPDAIRAYIKEENWLCWNPIYEQEEDLIKELVWQTSNLLGLWVTFAFSKVRDMKKYKDL